MTYRIILQSIFLNAFGLLNINAQDFQVAPVSLPSTHSTNLATGITQDQYGNIWMSSGSQGLIRYNGKDFTSFNSERNNPNSLISDRLECIHADHNGYIWVGSFSGGLSRYDNISGTFKNFIHDVNDSLTIRSNAIRSFAEDTNGGIWIGTAEGIDYWNPATEQFEHNFAPSEAAESLQKEHVRVLYMDKSGILWAGTSSPFYGEQSEGGLFRIDPSTKKVSRYSHSDDIQSLKDNCITAIFEDSRGTFWVGTAGDGLHTMDRELGKFQRHSYDPLNPSKLSRPNTINLNFASDHIRFINEDALGRIWIGTFNNGINLFDPKNSSVIHLNDSRTDQYRLPYNDFWSALFTKDNLIWLTGWSPANNDQILFKVNLNPKHIDENVLGLPVYTFKEDKAGSIYAGSESGVYRLSPDDQTEGFWNIPNSGRWQDIQIDSEGHLWISSTTGLAYYNTRSRNGQIFPVYDIDLAIGDLLELTKTQKISNDSILVGTSNGLFLFHIPTKKFEFIPIELSDRTERTVLYISDILIDHKKNIWIGLANFGLIKMSSDFKTIKRYKFQENISDTPFAIRLLGNNELYISNWRSGLRQYDYSKDTFAPVIDETGRLKSDSYVYDVFQLSERKLLVLTQSGLFQYDLRTNTTIVMETSLLNTYDLSPGSKYFSNDGFFYLGTSEGYIKFKPGELSGSTESYNPKPMISRLAVGDQIFRTTSEDLKAGIHLKHDQNNVAFKLSYINFLSAVKEGAIQYKLENHDEQWQNGQNDQEVYYFKLAPGQYKFKLKAQNDLGEWAEDAVIFIINPPWWLTWWAYSIYGLFFTTGAWVIHRTQKERTIRQERERARERELTQAREIEKAYKELKTTQSQLIQSEKMASLGELTAGIAHEIQNPLNFVNNFSEVNEELLVEMKEELDKGNIDDAKEIANHAIENQQKILHHGKKADAIVKGMLQHSRSSSGVKEPADINALAEEYLRLAYHGLRAKDKSFNATMKTDFDKTIGSIDIIPQDIGRVILNLINNAFYAVNERLRQAQPDSGYEPTVTVCTKKSADKIEILVKDNGNGIPVSIKEKIFQPFFTTKPTGQGTGLGLSLSYDTVKANGGELKVETKENDGSEFTIQLPLA